MFIVLLWYVLIGVVFWLVVEMLIVVCIVVDCLEEVDLMEVGVECFYEVEFVVGVLLE